MLFSVTSASFSTIFIKILFIRNPNINMIEYLFFKYAILALVLLIYINFNLK